MKKTLTVAEARNIFDSEKVFQTETGFIVNDFGKYRPNITFVVDSSFELDENGKAVNPLRFFEDREVTDSFNLSLEGQAKILFGDFWRSKKGGACFRPKDPRQAKHILVKVSWGGAFNQTRGFSGNGVTECGAIYFRRASSNGGGSGYDYWVLPVGYVHQYGTNAYRVDWETARAYCARISATSEAVRAEAHRLYEQRLADEERSRQNREMMIPELEKIQARYAELRQVADYGTITIDEMTFTLGYRQPMLFLPENLAIVRENLAKSEASAKELMAKKLMEQQKKEEFTPKFEALSARAEAVGFKISTTHKQQAELYRGDERIMQKDYSGEGLKAFDVKIREEEQKQQAERREAEKLQAEAEAKAAGLPSDIRVWKRTGGRTGCSKGWVISPEGIDRERDELFNENSRRAQRYDEGYEIWHQILPGELVIQWQKACTAGEHDCQVIHRPEVVTEAQLERVAEIQQNLEGEWAGLTGLASGKESPSIGDGWLTVLLA